MSSPPPILARGQLAQTSLAEFLVVAADRQLSGSYVLQTSSGQKSAIYFERGAPARARLSDNLHLALAPVLRELGFLDTERARRLQQLADAKGLPEISIVLEEAWLDSGALALALREHLSRQVLSLCTLPGETGFGFYDADFLQKPELALYRRIPPQPLAFRALVQSLPDAKRFEIVSLLGESPLHLRFEAQLGAYRLHPDEEALLSLLRAKPMSLAQLRNAGVGKPEEVVRVAVALFCARLLAGTESYGPPLGQDELDELVPSRPSAHQAIAAGPAVSAADAAHQVSSGSARPAAEHHSFSPAPRVMSSMAPVQVASTPTPPPGAVGLSHEEAEAFRREVAAFEDDPNRSLYEVLGVPREAEPAIIRARFFQLAKRWHPDRLPEELAELRSAVNRAFGRMSEAHQILTDPARRADYDKRQLAPLDEEQAQVAAILDAVSAFQRAEVLIKKRDLDGAFREAKAAYEGDDSQTDHLALFAWLKATHRGDLDDGLHLLDRAVEKDPENVRALWFRGQLYKKLGKPTSAVRDFRRVVALRPQHIEAQREIRLFEMRRRTDPKGAEDLPPAGKAGPRSPDGRQTSPRPGSSTNPRPSRTTNPNAAKETGNTSLTGLFGRLLKKD